MPNQRREFLSQSAALAVGLTAMPAFASSITRRIGAADLINVGVIGCNGMGWSNLQAILKQPDVRCIALCDVDENVLTKRAGELAALKMPVKTYKDHRELLANKDIDIVIIGTPDHWHCIQMVDACAAGKHVYVEKPCGNSVEECRVMEAAQKRHGSIVQVGQWQRSAPHFQDAINFVHSGKLGNIRTVKSWAYMGWMKPVPIRPDSAVPNGVDYTRWLGPATKRPFNANRFHFNFRWFWDYAGGLMTDWGVHMMDYALLGMKAQFPNQVMASGGKMAYPDDASETPDTLAAVFEYDKFNIVWEHATGIDLGPYGLTHGTAFIGNNGTLVLNREGWFVQAENGKMEPIGLQKDQGNSLERHMANFLDAIKTKDPSKLHTPIQEASLTAQVCQLGNIAFRTKELLQWDHKKNQLLNKAGNDLLKANYNNGYKVPKV
ncbi:Gfo/Idh/MocA family oxidoreductase [Flavihumibacter sp. CACIAM 22H1]|uniref:Gfo/Idh/MocA family protein n=1 Tax=Flavihumibacter sp. CACIAM 22H1 TaxID=1812911 RepID=UPI0007A7EBE8|nr:Gfo/Idh/MocA family oxidoreductase [Flavihumibacter sp. CACIAM 22H1]KYP16356.1 MAG: oxidoreductase [Flavihumibacter sp. CACIAM 22H1]